MDEKKRVRRKKLYTLTDIIPQELEKIVGRKEQKLGNNRGGLKSITEQWTNLVGDTIAKVAQPVKLIKDVLYVKVTSLAWKSELAYQKTSLIARIDAGVGDKTVRDISFIS